MPTQAPRFIPELVINWHITEACNFGCRYCYATWRQPASPKEAFHDPAITDEILQAISSYFQWGRSKNSLTERLQWDSVRLSIAGGEPLLYPERVIAIAKKSRELGMNVSLITNGTRLNADLMRELAPELSMIGISIDSADERINRLVEREDRHGRQLDLASLTQLLDLGREINPALRVKVNTVVSSENQSVEIGAVIDQIKPDKWKLLRVLPVVNDHMCVSHDAFQSFVKRQSAAHVPIFAEDNGDMLESYIMIDPHGRFFQNRLGNGQKGHVCSLPIAEVGAACAFESLQFDASQFAARYVPINKVGERT